MMLFSLSSAEKSLERVSLQLKWKYQFQFAGFIAAVEKGFYRDAGLDVVLLEYNDTIDTLARVAEGKATFGVTDASLIPEALEGAPVVALLAIYQHSLYTLMTLHSSGIRKLADLDGKRLSIFGDVNGKSLRMMLRARNIDFIRESTDRKLTRLQNGEVDAIIAYIANEPFVAKERGMEINSIDPAQCGSDSYGDILFTSKKLLERDPDLLRRMRTATIKGFEYAFSHIDEMVDLIYEKYNTLHKSKAALRYEAEILKPLSGIGKNFGSFDQKKISRMMHACGFMYPARLDLTRLNHFIYREDAESNRLTEDELAYLKSRKIRVCAQKNFYPLEFIKEGRHRGIAADYLRLITKNYPFDFELVPFDGVGGTSRKVSSGACDIKTIVLRDFNIAKDYMDETATVISDYPVLVTTSNKPMINGIESLAGKKIATDAIAIKKFMERHYPYLKITLVNDLEEAADALFDGEIYAFIDASLFANTIVQKYGFDKLKVNIKLSDYPLEGAIGVRKDEPELLAIFNKLIRNTSAFELETVGTRWSIQTYHRIVDYRLIWQIALGSLLVLSILLFFVLRYRREIEKRKEVETSLRLLNEHLEERISVEVEKSRQQQLLMLQQSRYAQIGEMITMIAHQWRQPLNNLSIIIQGVVLKYKMGKMDDTLMSRLERDSRSQITQMSQTIDDFRNFFKPDKESSLFSVDEPILNAVKLLRPSFEQRQILLETDLEKDIVVKGFGNELGQVLVIILNNAKDAIVERQREQEGEIRITMMRSDHDVVIMVEDNGGGIDEKIIGRIFEPYFSTKQEKNGTGLGLYMAKTIIVEHCRGELSVSNTREGACFKIILKEKL